MYFNKIKQALYKGAIGATARLTSIDFNVTEHWQANWSSQILTNRDRYVYKDQADLSGVFFHYLAA